MSFKEARNTREIIEAEYPEFPETILHAELCRACARVDGRSIKQSLKAFALARIEKVESKPLKGALDAMETPATDALLAEVRAQGVDVARNALIKFVEDEVGPNTNVPGLIRGAKVCVSIAAQLRKGAAL